MMVKINHNRPSLRYLDNLRRELNRQDRTAPYWFDAKRSEILANARNPDPLDQHLKRFNLLQSRSQSALDSVFAAFEEHQKASLEVISLIMKPKPKQMKARKLEQEAAFEQVVVSGALLVKEIIADASENREGAWQWLQGLHALSDRQMQMTWKELSSILLEESLPLYLAQLVADSPEQVDRLRSYLTEDNWA